MKKTLLLLLSICQLSTILMAQITFEELAPMPERVSNNAVAHATVNGVPYVYSFSGIDSTKEWSGIHLKSYRYNTALDTWDRIADLPDPNGGKIAAGASTVGNKIYIIGGYHVSSNLSETTSDKVHIYDPATNTYLPDGAAIPKAVDDHVQAVYRDSLIFLVSGWSDFNNVRNVQIYDPANDIWQVGTPIPNSSKWKVFGGSGTIIGDTLYYVGGAGNWNGSNFPPTSYLRKGYINPENPTDIDWMGEDEPLAKGYRMAAGQFENKAIWIGGADVTYNFDGIAYNNSGGVSPLSRVSLYEPMNGNIAQFFDMTPTIMDLRGLAQISNNEYIIAGGMEAEQVVTNKAFLIHIEQLTNTKKVADFEKIGVYPNPTTDEINILKSGDYQVNLVDLVGNIQLKKEMSKGQNLDVSSLANGIYFLQIVEKGQITGVEKVLIQR